MDSSVLVEPSTGTPVENSLSVIGSERGTTGGIKKSDMLRVHSFMSNIGVGLLSL